MDARTFGCGPAPRLDLADLQNRHGTRLLREARRFTRNYHDAEDLLQDLWVHVWPRLDTIRSVDAAGAFLSRALLHLALNRHRHDSRRVQALSLEDLHTGDRMAVEECLASDEKTPEQQFLQHAEDAERVVVATNALGRLARKNRKQAEVIIHHDLAGREYAELPGNASTWRTRRERGLAWLRQRWGPSA